MARLSPVSSLAPSCRLLCLALLSSACLLMPIDIALFSAIALAILIVIEGIGPLRLLKETAFILWFAAFALALQGLDFRGGIHLDQEGLHAAFAYSARLFAAYLAGRLFYATTSRRELREAASAVAGMVPAKAKGGFGLAFSLILGYLPLVVDEWRSSLEAARARGLPSKPSLDRSAKILASYLRRLMLASVAVPEALLARGWSAAKSGKTRKWRIREYCCVALLCGLLAVLSLEIV